MANENPYNNWKLGDLLKKTYETRREIKRDVEDAVNECSYGAFSWHDYRAETIKLLSLMHRALNDFGDRSVGNLEEQVKRAKAS